MFLNKLLIKIFCTHIGWQLIWDREPFSLNLCLSWVHLAHRLAKGVCLDPKCVFAHQCTCVCQVRLGWRVSVRHPGGSWRAESWAASGGSLRCCGLRVSESPCSKSQNSSGLKLFAKVHIYMIIPVLRVDSFDLHWCWNNVFLQGETNIRFPEKKEQDWVLFRCPVSVAGFAGYSWYDLHLDVHRQVTHLVWKKDLYPWFHELNCNLDLECLLVEDLIFLLFLTCIQE